MIVIPLREQVRAQAAEKGMLLRDIATQLQLSPTRLSYILAQNRTSAEFIERVAEIFGISPWVFDAYVSEKLPELVSKNAALLEINRALCSQPRSRLSKAILDVYNTSKRSS